MSKQRGAQQQTRRGGWRQWSATEAQQVLSEWKTTGLPLATFARRRGLKDTRLRWWQTRLAEWHEESPPAKAPAFIPAVAREVIETAIGAPVTVRVPGGVVVEVADPASVPSNWLTAVVSGLSRAG